MGEDCGNSRTGNSPMEYQNAQQIKQDIQERRKQQEPERCLAVSQSPDNTGQQVIEESAGNTDKSNQQIPVSILKDIFRSLHGSKNKGTQQAGDQSYTNRHHACQFQADRNQTAHRYIITRTEFLCHGNTESPATSVAKTQNEKYNRRTGTYGSQRIYSQKLTDNSRINQRISLLKHVPQQQRQRKIKYQGQAWP